MLPSFYAIHIGFYFIVLNNMHLYNMEKQRLDYVHWENVDLHSLLYRI